MLVWSTSGSFPAIIRANSHYTAYPHVRKRATDRLLWVVTRAPVQGVDEQWVLVLQVKLWLLFGAPGSLLFTDFTRDFFTWTLSLYIFMILYFYDVYKVRTWFTMPPPIRQPPNLLLQQYILPTGS